MKSKSLNLILIALALMAPIQACQKPSVTGQSQTGGGGGGVGGETLEKVDFEVIGLVSDEDPGDLANSSSSEVGGSLNLSAGSGYQISVLSISPDGQKILEHESVSASRSFKLNFKAPKRYLSLEILRRADNRKFKAILPPPKSSKTASVHFDKTSTIAGVIVDKVLSSAVSGNQSALEALASQSVSVADIMKIAQSVRRTIDEQKAQGAVSAIDLSATASSVLAKSNERLASLQSSDLSASSLAGKISDTTYTDLFGQGAEIVPPGVLAHMVDHKLGAAPAATTDVAYEAIKATNTQSMKQVEEAFRAEADAFRAAGNLADALAAEQVVAANFAARFNDCISNASSCAATAYIPPVPPVSTLSIPSSVALILPTALAPESSVLAGSYMTPQAVTITSGTAGATIYYTTDGSSPTLSSSIYSSPILVQVSQTIKAIAVKSGYQNSGVGTFSYTITGTVQAPSFSVAAGGYGPSQSVVLSSATPGATIYYTTNGTTPSRSSSIYSSAITVSATQTIKAFAVLENWADSSVSSAQYTINGQVAAPSLSVASGTYTSQQSVTLSTATSGALIYYTTNGDTPSASSTLYSGAISVGSSMTIKVIAVKSGYSNSNVSMGEYTLNIPLPLAATPTASQAAGAYTTAKTVTLSSDTAGATIYYTTNDSVPTTSSAVYSSPILVQVSQTIKAIAVKSGYQNSGVGTFSYTITGTVQAPSFSVAAGGYGPAQSVVLSSATPGATIYYTTNGTTPSRSSSIYSGAITVSATQTIKAFAVLENWADSSVSSAQYTINGQASAPTFSVTGGTYPSAQSVSLSSTTSGAMIYYTTNGDVPSASSTLYAGAINVASSMTIKAIAIKSGYSNSSVSEAQYTINIPLPIAAAPVASPVAATYSYAQSVELSSATSDAGIYYTTDGSDPSTSSIFYSSPILVQVSQTIKAVAVKSGYQNSGVGTFSYTITGTVQAPSFSVAAGGYGPAQSVVLGSATPGATIYYTTNGDTPSRSSNLYSGAITVSATQTIKAFAVLENWADSSVSSAQYTINGQASAPTFSVTGGTYTSAQSVTLSSATADALIYYTVNGDTPSASSNLYTSAINVASSMTIKAITVKDGYSDSGITDVQYMIDMPVDYLWTYRGGSMGCAPQGLQERPSSWLGEALGYEVHGGNCENWCRTNYPTAKCAEMYATWAYGGGACNCYSSTLTYSWPGWGDREVWATDGPRPVITINTQPSSQTASNGTASLTVGATVTEGATLSYQWQRAHENSFSNIVGATSSTLLITNLTHVNDDGRNYRVVVSATGGAYDVTSNAAMVTVPAPQFNSPISISSLLVAGGGGGGVGGGGGAGGLLYYGGETPQAGNSLVIGLDDTYVISVGAGGSGLHSNDVATPTNGGNTSIVGPGVNIVAYGGGSGATGNNANGGGVYSSDGYTSYLGAIGGSGGGSGGNSHGTGRFVAGGQGTAGQGHKGGDLNAEYSCSPAAGGGGAGGPGATVYGSPSAGGTGLQYSISGSAKYYAGGGGGGSHCAGGANGGAGGGGNGAPHDQVPTAGVDGTGGGGGGGGTSVQNAGRGGSGIVVIRYPDSYNLAEVSGSVGYTLADGYHIYEIRSDSSFKIPSTPSSIKPSAPVILTAVPSDSRITLSWAAPAYPPTPVVTDYLVQFSSDGGATWGTFHHPESAAATIDVTGLTNGMAYKFRVAAVSSAGTGSFSNIYTATPSIIPVISVLEQPKNNVSFTWNESVPLTFNAQISDGANLSYQWQYYTYDYYSNQWAWIDVPGGQSSTLNISPTIIYNNFGYYGYNSDLQFRCVATGDQGATPVTSNAVRWLDYSSMYPYAYGYGDWGSYSNGSENISGNYYEVHNPQPGENLTLNYYDMSYTYMDTSWYSGDAFTIKFQESSDGTNWTDIESLGQRGNGFWGYKSLSAIPGSTRYYRMMLYYNWPLSITNGTQSAARSDIQPRFIGGVKVNWPAPPEYPNY